jgi:predicted metal-binding membrane protein
MIKAERTTANTRRSPGAVRSLSSVAVGRRDRIVVTGSIILIAALAWAYLIQIDHRMSAAAAADPMAAMGMVTDQPWSARDVLFTFAMWSFMMAAMMAPAATPMLQLIAGAQAQRARGAISPVVLSFALGYATVWVGFSAFAAIAQWLLHQATLLSGTDALSSPWLAGGVLVGAGVYQLTPLKSGCLRHCQSPLGFIMSHWRAGAGGAYRMGLQHGIYCLGCCWALMAVLFVVGVMNLAWIAALTGFVFVEKLGPQGRWLARAGGALLIIWGVVVLTRTL